MIFIDTTVWVGDTDLNDDFHESSHQLIESVRTGKMPLGLATDFIIAILASPRVFTIFVNESILKEALAAYPTYSARLSLTDVVSTIVMKRYDVRDIFSTTQVSTQSKLLGA